MKNPFGPNLGGSQEQAVETLSPPEDPRHGERWVSPVDLREMVWLEGGVFEMGSAGPGMERDEAAHEASVEGLWMDVRPVTNASYREFLLVNPDWQKGGLWTDLQGARYLADWKGLEFPEGQGEAPVTWVSWHAARAYCEWAGKRLPTEAEWEYACRAGTSTRYWWGDEFDPLRAAQARQPIDERNHANPWGLVDITGNAWEWTASLYAEYPYDANDGREDLEPQGERVLRGGAWPDDSSVLRSSFRERNDPLECVEDVGFRCALSPSLPPGYLDEDSTDVAAEAGEDGVAGDEGEPLEDEDLGAPGTDAARNEPGNADEEASSPEAVEVGRSESVRRGVSPVDGKPTVWIPAGRFVMGSPYDEEYREDGEQPHPVRISVPFWMDMTTVTCAEFLRFLQENRQWMKGRIAAAHHDGHYLENWQFLDFPRGQDDYPVTFVSWYAARAYAEWAGKRLPTEAEWEYACRAGSKTTYWWGDEFDEARASLGGPGPTPAGDPAHINRWGLADMSGNVWEWTSSLFRDYPYRAGDGREGPDAPGERVVRGGAWTGRINHLRSAVRDGFSPASCKATIGFRCASDARERR